MNPDQRPFVFPSRHPASGQGIPATQSKGRARGTPRPSDDNFPARFPGGPPPQSLAFQNAYNQTFHEPAEDVRPLATPDRRPPPPPPTPSLQSGSATTITGSADNRFSDIAIKAITESQRIADDLVQQKSYANSLLAEQKTAHKRLADAQRDSAFAKKELLATQANLTSTQALLLQAEEDALAAKAELTRMEEELSQRKNDADMARIAAEEEKVEKVELKKKLSHVKHKLMQLSEDYVIFRKGQLDLKTSYEKVKLTLEHTLRELLELRRTSSDQMASMRPFLIEGGHIAQTKQLKAVISKLQCGLDEADRVADLLRDKLHHQKAQLVDSTAKVKELEHNRTEGWNEKMIVGRNLDRFETKLEGLTERMIKREEVLVGALAEAALAETKAAMAVEKQQEAQIALQEKEEELIKLRGISDENIKIRLQMNSADHKTSELAAKNHEILHKLSEAEHKLRCREKETIALQSELQLLEADARKLQLLLDQSKEITQKSSEELSNMTVKENIATEKNDTMEAESLRVKGEIDHLNKSLHQSNLQLVIIQEKFDSQATTLRSVREENRNLQERLLEREKSFAGKFWALEASIAVLREQKCTVETQLIEQCEKIKSERVVFADASAIFKKQVAGRETASRLLETQEQRAADAEGNAADSKRRLVEMQSRAEAAEAAKLELEGCVEAQSARLKNETAAALELMEEMVMLKKKVVVLEQSSTIELTLARNLKGKEQASPESRLMVDSGFGISSSPQAVMMSPFRPLSYSSPVNAEAQASPVGPTPAISPRETRFRTQLGLNPSPSPLTVAPKFSTLSGMDTDDDDSELSDPPTSSPVMLEKRKRVVSPMNNKGSQRHLKALPKLALPILRRGSRDRHPARMKEPVVLSARGNQDHKPSWRG